MNYLIIDISKLANQYTYSFTTSTITSDFVLTGIISIDGHNSSLQYAYINLNKINKFSCSGFNCDSCLSIDTCRQLNGNIFDNKCLRCSSNEIFSNAEGCVCKNGYYRLNKICWICQEGTIYNK